MSGSGGGKNPESDPSEPGGIRAQADRLGGMPGPPVPGAGAARDRGSPVSRLLRSIAWTVVVGAWAATMAGVIRGEVVRRRESPDVRALVDSARLTRTHASARYAIRVGSVTVGSLSSTVSGGQHDEQLAYVIEGELTTPQEIRLRGVVLAGWDRRPQRLVLEATLAGQRHRLEGTLRPDASTGGSLFELRYVPPPGGTAREGSWVLPEAPTLAPGPLPIPELQGAGDDPDVSGVVPDPQTGSPLAWSVATAHLESLTIAGRTRVARRHEVQVGAWRAQAWTERTGFPLRIDLPGSITVELVEEKR